MAVLDVEKLQSVMASVGFRQSDFINKLYEEYDIRKDTSRTWIRGTRNPREDNIHKMAQLLKVDPQDIVKDELSEYTVSERIVPIPMFKTIQKIIFEDYDDDTVLQKLRLESKEHHQVITSKYLENFFATRVMDGSHASFIPNGSIVTWHYGLESLVNNSIVVINQELGITYFRRVGISGDDLFLYDLRDEYREDPKLLGSSETILGVAVQIEYKPLSHFRL